MRIMLDANILVSASVFGGRVANAIDKILENHKLVVCDAAIKELYRVVDIKFPERKAKVKRFMRGLPFKPFHTPKKINPADYPHIRDPDDLPILASAILADVDVIITGDTDFQPVNIDRPEILTISRFIEKYGRE